MRRGAALPMVLMTLGLVGALAVGGAFASRRFVDDARTDNRSLELLPAAERALALALASLDSTTLTQPPGSTFAGDVQVTQASVTSAWITVIGPGVAWVAAEAETSRKPVLRKRLAVLCRMDIQGAPRWAGLTWFELP